MAQTPNDLARPFRGSPRGLGQSGDGRTVTLPPSGPPPPLRGRPRLKKLRLALVLAGLSLLAGVSWIFGIMMAVAQDLPELENREQYKHAENSIITDRTGEEVATLTGNEKRILVGSEDIAQTVKQAVVAIEDERFYEHRGIDPQGILRAVGQDILQRSTVQGGSTITQQFVKNALQAQGSRTIFQKLRESALAYHLERQWAKDKILTEYLNSIYLGEGAYGIESAARTYFGWNHPGCGDTGNRCAAQLLPEEAALLAAIISSPAAYSPRNNPDAALERRNLVLQKMTEQGMIAEEEYEEAASQALPAPSKIKPPEEESEAPYFTDWLRQQVVDRYGAGEAFGGGLKIKSTLDLELQRAVEQEITGTLSSVGLSGSSVVIDNKTGGVLAMVGGSDYDKEPFNLATNGQRQPGSAFKPFTLVSALEQGHSPDEVYSSQQKVFNFRVPGVKKPQKFEVNNYEDQYLGSASITTATTNSDNSVYAELGLQVGTENIARTAEKMGIESRLSTNPAMILGGLKTGVTPLEMAYAFSTLARGGQRAGGTMDAAPGADLAPVGIETVKKDGELVKDSTGGSGENEVKTDQVVPEPVAEQAVSILETVVSSGTGTAASTGDYAWGKTGTTDNNADAWFCGGTEEVTACVWVGHADSSTPMETEHGGGPVDGGTFPAEIWRDIILAYESILAGRGAEDATDSEVPLAPTAPAPAAPVAPAPTTEAVPVEPEAPAPVEEAPTPAAPPPTDTGTETGGDGATTGGTG